MVIVEVRLYMYKATFGLADCKLASFRDTTFLSRLDNDPVYYYLYIMLKSLLKLDLVFTQDLNFPIYSHSGESLTLDAVQDLLMSALLGTDDRSQHQKLRPFVHGHDRIHHLVHRLR